MRSYARRLAQSCVTTDLLSGAVSTQVNASATYDDFTVTGFGPNPGRKFIDPTPGEYKKQLWTSPHGLVYRRYKYTSSGEVTYHIRKDGWQNEFGDNLNSQHPVFYDNTTYNNALSDLYAGIRQSEINFAVMLGELHETGRMLQVGRSIYEILLNARRARRRFLRNPSESISSAWLAYQYGWKPAYNELFGILNWLYHSFDDGIPVRGRARRIEGVYLSGASSQYPQGTWLHRGRKEWRAEVKCWVGLNNTTHYNLSRISSLNPVSIAWELVPLSFAWDWFLDFGGYLQNMEAALMSGVSFKRGYVTEVANYQLEQQTTLKGATTSGSQTLEWFGYYKVKKDDVWKRRQKLLMLPFPRAPRLELRLGWQRIVSAAALVRTILLGGIDDEIQPRRRPRRRPRVHVWTDFPHR